MRVVGVDRICGCEDLHRFTDKARVRCPVARLRHTELGARDAVYGSCLIGNGGALQKDVLAIYIMGWASLAIDSALLTSDEGARGRGEAVGDGARGRIKVGATSRRIVAAEDGLVGEEQRAALHEHTTTI